jgi:hypothetical protein
MPKAFRLRPDQVRNLISGLGSCIASDLITVAGSPVGYMYREAPDGPVDSGWRFLAGSETQDFLDDPGNLELYDVNTIANYDPSILPHLNAPIGSQFERTATNGFRRC